jgi:NADH dehydrogenase/NADH:ubiquinone oxidoreductase subunit G
MIGFRVDNKEIEAQEGTPLLRACLDNDIYIPNLCWLEGTKPAASCRMCWVEIEGKDRPVASCTVAVAKGMVVCTDTSDVRRLQRTAFRLLLSVHDVDCRNCPANKKCELQRIGRFLNVGLKLKHLERFLKDEDTSLDHPLLDLHPNRCVLCGKCIHACRNRHGQSALFFSKRGFDTLIRAYAEEDARAFPCENCTACVDICPVAAITLK